MSPATLAVTEYCERSGAGFWAEPLNAVSNLAFVLAAVLIARQQWRAPRQRPELWLLALLAAAVGVGSFLWHTLATPWSEWADVIPIGLFIDVFLLVYLRRVVGWSWPLVLGAFALYQAANYAALAHLPPDLLNGSVFYLPTWLALLLLTLYGSGGRGERTPHLPVMLAIFTVSLVLRSVDMLACPVFPAGTHFAWHLMNAVVLYQGMRLLAD
jgi:hypothetical protein